jgi:hypothetical protein
MKTIPDMPETVPAPPPKVKLPELLPETHQEETEAPEELIESCSNCRKKPGKIGGTDPERCSLVDITGKCVYYERGEDTNEN